MGCSLIPILSLLTLNWILTHTIKDFPGGSDSDESNCNVEDLGLIPASRRSPGEETGNPLQYSGVERSMDRGAWWATVHRVSESQTQTSD